MSFFARIEAELSTEEGTDAELAVRVAAPGEHSAGDCEAEGVTAAGGESSQRETAQGANSLWKALFVQIPQTELAVTIVAPAEETSV